jgi:hypothetical protein
MNRRRRLISLGVLIATLIPIGNNARADIWGADVAVLSQILQQSILQLTELRSILKSGEDTFGLLEEINRGINDSIQLAETNGIRIDPGVYRDLKDIDKALKSVQDAYGKPVESKDAKAQQNTDQTIAEALSFNNEINSYTNQIDRIGEEIKNYSHAVSPGGAAKLTAESLGVMIHVMDQQMRATGHGLKLQAQAMAVQNKKEKEGVEQYLKEGKVLKERMQALNPTFQLPRF